MLPPPTPPALVQAHAVLPAATQAAGPPSGRRIAATNGARPPFARQPVQGFSGLVPLADGRLLATTDNGYGAMETSADFLLRIYTLRPDWARGTLKAEAYVTLSDPGHRIPWTIVNDATPTRQLTGMDFDPESLARAADGTLWLGDEFGPFLLHVDRGGQLLEPPIPVPDPLDPTHELASPQHPGYEESTAVRLLAALQAEVERAGGRRAVVCSPDHHLIVDGDPAFGQADRPGAASKLFDPLLLARAGFPTVPWTINDPARGRVLAAHGVAGLITDRPDLFMGLAPEIQGHRGARDLRPENTLPSFEAALDVGVPTLETDCHLTRDGVLVLSHEGNLEAPFIRRADGKPLAPTPIRTVGFDDLQARYVADGLQPGRAAQRNDRALSPVAVAFARAHGLPDPYVMPSLDQLFDFVAAYADYYETKDPRRAANARRVAFNLETKGRPYAFAGEPASDAAALARQIAAHARTHGVARRTTIESFDFAALLATAREQPEIGIVALFGDWQVSAGGDGTNLPDRDGKSPWLGGMRWPYRHNFATRPPRLQASAGLEGLSLTPAGHLIAALERGLVGDAGHRTWFQAYDPKARRWTGERWAYPLDARASSIADIAMRDATHGFATERDGSQGDTGFKRIFAFTLGAPTTKSAAVDLLALRRHGRPYTFPYECPEGLALLDARHLLVIDDNNYPFGHARHPGRPDDTELLLISLP